MLTLRDYQKDIIRDVVKAFKDGFKAPLVVAPTGSGKTIIFSHIATGAVKKDKRVLILTHRREILQQTLSKLFLFGIQAGQIASGRPMTDELIQVAMIGTIVRRLNTIIPPDLIIIDECITGDSLILTDKGEKRIDTIKVDDMVLSKDNQYHRVYKTIKKEFNVLYTIKLESGIHIRCTGNHEIYTREGFKKASDITTIDMVHTIMYDNAGGITYGKNDMPYMRNRIYTKRQSYIQEVYKNKTTLLLFKVFKRIFQKSIFGNYGKNKQKIRFRENEDKQPYALSGDTGEGKNKIKSHESQANNTGRKWKKASCTAITTCNSVTMGHGSSSSDKDKKGKRIPYMLQNRYSKSNSKDSNRSRWSLPQFFKSPRSRQEEKRLFNWERVESIEIQKRGNNGRFKQMCSDSFVYDLSVEGSHNYFANKICVHNCHHSTSNTWKKVIEHFKNAIRIGFTATPERLSGEGLIETFDTLIMGPHLIDLVKSGHLSYPKIYSAPVDLLPGKMKITRGDYDTKEQTEKMKKRVVIGSVIDHYKKYLNGLPTVCFCVSIEHCHAMEGEFRGAGFRSRTIHGKMNRTDRDASIRGLETGEVQVLCSCDVISEGVDVPVIAGAILLRRTKSLGLYLQQVGRALRPYPGKTQAIILDHSGVVQDHGHVLNIRDWSLYAKKRSKRKNDIKAPEVTVCPKCTAVWPGLPKTCPDCGHNLQEDRDRKEGRKPPKEIEGILREVLPEDTEEAQIKALIGQALSIQQMTPRDRQKAMMSNLYKYGKSERNKGLATALGYAPQWTETVYRRLIKNG